jgi:hypothetical protein
MHRLLIDRILKYRSWWKRSGRLVVELGLVGGMLLLSACSASSAPPGPGDSPPADNSVAATVAAIPAPFSTPKAEALPPGAEPLGQGDYGIADAGSGLLKGTLASTGLSCDDEGFLHIDTDQGTFVAGVVSAADWNCTKALSDWQRDNPAQDGIGLRYTLGGGLNTILIVNDAGNRSMTLRVSGAWKIS